MGSLKQGSQRGLSTSADLLMSFLLVRGIGVKGVAFVAEILWEWKKERIFLGSSTSSRGLWNKMFMGWVSASLCRFHWISGPLSFQLLFFLGWQPRPVKLCRHFSGFLLFIFLWCLCGPVEIMYTFFKVLLRSIQGLLSNNPASAIDSDSSLIFGFSL